MKKIFLCSILLLPTFAGAQPVCENTTLQKITNQFQSEVSRYESQFAFDESASGQSPDFAANDLFWRQTGARAKALMPTDMFRVYEDYEKTYVLLDKIYEQNRGDAELSNYYACRKEFFTKELFGALWNKSIGRAESACDSFIQPEESDRLFYELGTDNLSVCRAAADTESSASDGSNLSAEGSTNTVPVSQPKLDLGLSQSRLTANEIKIAKQSIEQIDGASLSDEEDAKNILSRIFQSFFGKRKKELTNEEGELRTGNVVGTREIDTAIQARRVDWENSRNFWLRTSQKSGEQLDRYHERLAVKIFETLDETTKSIKKSLDLIENVCARQKTITKCWKGPTYPRKDLRSPKDTVNSEDGSGEEGTEN